MSPHSSCPPCFPPPSKVAAPSANFGLETGLQPCVVGVSWQHKARRRPFSCGIARPCWILFVSSPRPCPSSLGSFLRFSEIDHGNHDASQKHQRSLFFSPPRFFHARTVRRSSPPPSGRQACFRHQQRCAANPPLRSREASAPAPFNHQPSAHHQTDGHSRCSAFTQFPHLAHLWTTHHEFPPFAMRAFEQFVPRF